VVYTRAKFEVSSFNRSGDYGKGPKNFKRSTAWHINKQVKTTTPNFSYSRRRAVADSRQTLDDD